MAKVSLEVPLDIVSCGYLEFVPDTTKIYYEEGATDEQIEDIARQRQRELYIIAEVEREREKQRTKPWVPKKGHLRESVVRLAAWCLLNIEAIDKNNK